MPTYMLALLWKLSLFVHSDIYISSDPQFEKRWNTRDENADDFMGHVKRNITQ